MLQDAATVSDAPGSSVSTRISRSEARLAVKPVYKIPMLLNVTAEKCTWPAADPLALPAGSLHVWCTNLDLPPSVIDRLATTLSEHELARVAAFRQARERRRFVAARGALRTLLARYLSTSPKALHFETGAHGKPSLSENPLRLCFNVSHTHELALFAVRAGVEVGIDAEYGHTLREADAIAARFFSPGERADLAAIPHEQRTAAFFACWTRKEAYIKLLGKGLAQALDEFQVTVDPAVARVIWVKDIEEASGAVSLQSLNLPSPYFGAVATYGPIPALCCSRWKAGT